MPTTISFPFETELTARHLFDGTEKTISLQIGETIDVVDLREGYVDENGATIWIAYHEGRVIEGVPPNFIRVK